ncbi:unnamed protein product [Protopolystoma xenopodis]|uniref:Uncharacterized protein n=1 Tax=Protopolystoma xenopodis TaxID=117903 RepID=A0A448WLZ3_9PLAT|nr:unnamed protein product [Protopolystoma xenopodis]
MSGGTLLWQRVRLHSSLALSGYVVCYVVLDFVSLVGRARALKARNLRPDERSDEEAASRLRPACLPACPPARGSAACNCESRTKVCGAKARKSTLSFTLFLCLSTCPCIDLPVGPVVSPSVRPTVLCCRFWKRQSAYVGGGTSHAVSPTRLLYLAPPTASFPSPQDTALCSNRLPAARIDQARKPSYSALLRRASLV